jgi:PleD family two-component response regulator
LLRRWRAMVFQLDGTRLQGLSFSAGIADTQLAPASPDALLSAADALLFEAKRAGRNRVGVASAPLTSS